MKQYKIYQKALICIMPFVCVAVLYFSAQFVIHNIQLPGCITYTAFGIHCPGCGMTRSVIALVNGDILLSLRQNAFIIVGIIISVLFYIEFAVRAFGVDFRLPFHKTKYLYILLIIMGIYAVLRNIIPQIAPI